MGDAADRTITRHEHSLNLGRLQNDAALFLLNMCRIRSVASAIVTSSGRFAATTIALLFLDGRGVAESDGDGDGLAEIIGADTINLSSLP